MKYTIEKITQPIFVFFWYVLLSVILQSSFFTKEPTGFHVWRQTLTQSNVYHFYNDSISILKPTINSFNDGNGQGVFRNEFPLYQYIVSRLDSSFGYSIFWSRFFSFFLGMLLVAGAGVCSFQLFQHKKAASLAMWSTAFMPILFYYEMQSMPDILALSAAVWAFAFLFCYYRTNQKIYWIFSVFFLGISVLQKLPFVTLLSCWFFYALFIEKKWSIKMVYSSLILLFQIPAFLWYSSVLEEWKNYGVVHGLFHASDFGVKELLSYYWFYFSAQLPENFLNYTSVIFFIAGIYFFWKEKWYRSKMAVMLMLGVFTVFLYFTYEANMILTYHDYYLFPFIPFILFILNYGQLKAIGSPKPIIKKMVLLSIILLPVLCSIKIYPRYSKVKAGFNTDIALYSSEIQKIIPKNAYCVVGNDESHHIFLYYMNRRGWCFNASYLESQTLGNYIQKGAQFILCDDNAFFENASIKPFLREKIFQKGSISMYTLQTK